MKSKINIERPRTIFDGLPEVITASERQGQKQLEKSDQLPTTGIEQVRGILEQAGGKILGPTKGDAVFTDVVLPPGWEVGATSHAMWSDLLDDQGRRRAGIFYKAAFYDRSAHINVVHRMQARSGTVDFDESPRAVYPVILSGDVELWRGAVQTEWTNEERKQRYAAAREGNFSFPLDADERCRQIAVDTLKAAFPLSSDVGAYWDLTDEQLKAKLPPWESQPGQGETYRASLVVVDLLVDNEPGEERSYYADFNYNEPRMVRRERRSRLVEVVRNESWKTKLYPSDDDATTRLERMVKKLLQGSNYTRKAHATLTIYHNERVVGQKEVTA